MADADADAHTDRKGAAVHGLAGDGRANRAEHAVIEAAAGRQDDTADPLPRSPR